MREKKIVKKQLNLENGKNEILLYLLYVALLFSFPNFVHAFVQVEVELNYQNGEMIYQKNGEMIYQNGETIYQNGETIYQNGELIFQNDF